MIRIPKYLLINITIFSLVICFYSNVTAEPPLKRAELHITDGKISAMLVNTTLRDIISQAKAQYDIWFKAGEELSGYKVSVQFTDIPLNEGLRRILKGMNHSLVYYADGRVAGVFILGNGEINQGYSAPTKVPVGMHARSSVKAATGTVENTTPPKISTPRPVNPSYLPRTGSDIRANTLGISLDLRNRMSRN